MDITVLLRWVFMTFHLFPSIMDMLPGGRVSGMVRAD